MTNWTDQKLSEREEQAIAAFMARLASLPAGAAHPPDAATLWWKAQLLRRWDAERVVERPLDVVESLEIAGGLIAAGLLLFWSLPTLQNLLPSIPGLR